MHKRVFNKMDRNAHHVNYHLQFSNWPHGLSGYLYLPFSMIQSELPPIPPSTSVGLASFLGGVTHTFIPEQSVPFVILPKLHC